VKGFQCKGQDHSPQQDAGKRQECHDTPRHYQGQEGQPDHDVKEIPGVDRFGHKDSLFGLIDTILIKYSIFAEMVAKYSVCTNFNLPWINALGTCRIAVMRNGNVDQPGTLANSVIVIDKMIRNRFWAG
jgi:hypothetical protein